MIEPRFGLLEKLTELNILSPKEFSDVSNEQEVYAKISKLLKKKTLSDLLSPSRSVDQFKLFLNALDATDQSHIKHLLEEKAGIVFLYCACLVYILLALAKMGKLI